MDFNFQSLEGHAEALAALRKGGRKQPFPSLVFDGPPRVGKRLVGIWYAAFLNCHSEQETAPCGICASCKKLRHGSHPDLHLTRVPEKKTVVGVSDVREAIHEIHHAPFEGRFRVWVIEEGERLTDEAQNALLKTLEEPPGRAIILLVTSLAGTLLPTVASRCRLVRFRALSPGEVEQALMRRNAAPELVSSLTSLCDGALGAALNLLENPASLEERASIVDMFAGLPGQDLWKAMETAQQLEKSKFGSTATLIDLGLSFYRDLLVLSAGSLELVVHKERMSRLEELAGQMSSGNIRKVIHEFQEADHYLQRNVSRRLLLQRLCMNLAKAV